MEPHGVENFCCGGGGGMLSMSEFAKERIAAGKVKADQIRATGAEIVVTSCHNCLDQLDEISRHYKLKVKVQNLSELVANAIVWQKQSLDRSGRVPNIVSPSGHRRPAGPQRQDHRRAGAVRRAGGPRAGRAAIQEGAGLHRPVVADRGRRSPLPQPGSLLLARPRRLLAALLPLAPPAPTSA